MFPETDISDMQRRLCDELDGNVTVYPSYASILDKIRNPLGADAYGDLSYHLHDNFGSSDTTSLSVHSHLESDAQSHDAPLLPKPRKVSLKSRLSALFKVKRYVLVKF